jgi:hypothetical protein
LSDAVIRSRKCVIASPDIHRDKLREAISAIKKFINIEEEHGVLLR